MTTERKNGYYLSESTNRFYPSVSTIMSKSGGAGGLVDWAAKQGGIGVIWALRRIQDYQQLKERLENSSVINFAQEAAIQGLQAEQKRVQGFGTDAHAGFEAVLHNKQYESQDAAVNTAVKTFADFYSKQYFMPLYIEKHVISEQHRFAGRLDLCVTTNDDKLSELNTYTSKNSHEIISGNIICDFKTGAIYLEKQLVQLAAYAHAIKENTGVECNGAMLINIERDNPEKIKLFYKSKTELDKAFETFLHMKAVWEYTEAPKWYNKQ